MALGRTGMANICVLLKQIWLRYTILVPKLSADWLSKKNFHDKSENQTLQKHSETFPKGFLTYRPLAGWMMHKKGQHGVRGPIRTGAFVFEERRGNLDQNKGDSRTATATEAPSVPLSPALLFFVHPWVVSYVAFVFSLIVSHLAFFWCRVSRFSISRVSWLIFADIFRNPIDTLFRPRSHQQFTNTHARTRNTACCCNCREYTDRQKNHEC